MNAGVDISGVILRTPRLTLRPWRMDDLDDFYEYARVDGVGQMVGWLPHRDREESRQILEGFIREKKTFALAYGGKVVGSLGVERYSEKLLPEFQDKKGRELGYVLSRDYWGRGLMPEAVREVIRWLFEKQGLDFIACGHFTDNLQSQRVQEKCGFVHYKRFKYETRYGEVRDTWISILERQATDGL